MRCKIASAACAAALIVVGSVPALADDDNSGIPEGSIAGSLPAGLGDPGGVRSSLGARGIVAGVNYIGEVFGNTSGGFEQSAHYDGRLELFVDIDMQKLIGWRGLSFHANGYQIHGTSITAENLGSLMPVSYIEATPATRLFELWLEQKFLDDKISVRFGQLAADSEFLLSEGGGAFINGTWGWPSITADNLPNGGPAYPLATPGVRVGFTPNDDLAFLVGVYNGDVVDNCPPDRDPQRCNDDGLDFPFGDDAFIMVEGAYKYSHALPGTIKVGGWKHTGNFDDVRVPDLVHGSDHGLYVILDQMIYKLGGDADEPRGISIFGRVIGSPDDRNNVSFYAEGGLTFSGFWAARPNDVLGVGYAYTGISGDVQDAAREAGELIIPDFESLIEVSYTAELVPGWTLQPDFQYFWNPGGHVPDETGTKAVGDAAVFGLRTSISY